MNYVEDFNKGEVGLDYYNSSEEDIQTLSELLPVHKDSIGVPHTLYQYYLNIRRRNYNLLVYDKTMDSYNAYGGNYADKFLSCYPLMTAEEILTKKKELEITEVELKELFYGN